MFWATLVVRIFCVTVLLFCAIFGVIAINHHLKGSK